jgi:hypothetical protein
LLQSELFSTLFVSGATGQRAQLSSTGNPVGVLAEAFGSNWKHLEASGSIWKHPEAFGRNGRMDETERFRRGANL